jgi:chromosome segregation ATPase
MQHEVEKKKLENKVKRENEAEENKIKLSKNSFNDNFATLVENIRVNELEKTVKKQKLDIEKKTKENADLKDSSDGLNNQITIWEESNKNLQDEMSLQKSIFEKKSNEVTDLNATINELKNKVSVMKKSSMISQDNINHEKMKLEEKYQKLEENYEAKCRQVEKLQSENRCQISDLEVQKTKIQEYEYFQKRHSTDLKKHTKDHQIKINIWKETGEKEKKDWEVKYESYVQLCEKKSEEVTFWKEKHDLDITFIFNFPIFFLFLTSFFPNVNFDLMIFSVFLQVCAMSLLKIFIFLNFCFLHF